MWSAHPPMPSAPPTTQVRADRSPRIVRSGWTAVTAGADAAPTC
jgi:hypothetical protein